jgi:cytochrome c oxidase subunit II
LKTEVLVGLLAVGMAAGVRAKPRDTGAAVEDVKTIDVTATRFQFDPATITVAQGDRVRLRLRSADTTHGIAIKPFRVKALIPKGGETVTIDFVADQAGAFDFTCAEYCGTGHSHMKGKLVVTPRGM